MQGVVSESEEMRKAALAVLGALILHLLLFLAVAIYLDWLRMPVPAPEPEKVESIELVFMAPPEPVVEMEKPEMIIVPEHAPDAESVQRPAFEADRTTRAAAELPATGTAPLPTQDATERPFVQMQTREYTDGEILPERPSEAATPVVAAAPTPMPRATPEPVSTPEPDTFALLSPKPTPMPVPEATPMPSPDQMLPPEPVSRPALASRPVYQPNNEATRIEGSIDNRGRSSVDAVATPLGQYRKNIADAIGKRWHYYTRSRMDLIRIGTARVKFQVTEDGTVENLRLVHNTSNEVGGTCSVQAILEAEIPPIPPDIASTLEGRRLEIEYTFTIY